MSDNAELSEYIEEVRLPLTVVKFLVECGLRIRTKVRVPGPL